MPQYLRPGLYIEEIERGPRPIEGVPTSIAAFLGQTERGPITPRLVTSYREYERWFGNIFDGDKFVPYVIRGFFENGGKQACVARLVSSGATSGEVTAGDFTIRASSPGKWSRGLFVRVSDSTTTDANKKPIGFRLQLAYWSNTTPYDVFIPNAKGVPPDLREDFDDLVTDEKSPDFYGKRFPCTDSGKSTLSPDVEGSALAILVRKSGATEDAKPANGAYTFTGGDDLGQLTDDDYIGLPTAGRPEPQGLEALKLDAYREISLVYAPAVVESTAKLIVDHCEKQRFRFTVLDSKKGQQICDLNPRSTITDSNYAAFYYPWIFVSDPSTGTRKLIPPGGHVLGVYARTDNDRGVFKAPANEILRGVLDLETDVNDGNQHMLTTLGVNVTRSFPDRGIYIWGARTLASDSLWKYVSVRRLFIFLERSIYEGTQWVVFEPNDDRLWARVIDTIRVFTRTQWRLGALTGRTEQEAFYITCDRTTMTQDDILNGRLICEIGIAPIRPAEFVVFRIFQHTAEASG